jgi:hypothetical protein
VLAVLGQCWLSAAPAVPAVVVDAQLLHPVLHALLKLLLVQRHILCTCLQASNKSSTRWYGTKE